MRSAGTRKPKKSNVNPVVAIVAILLAVLAAVAVLYQVQKPKPGGFGSGAVLTTSAVQARLKDVSRWEEEKKRARAEGRRPDPSLRPRAPYEYLAGASSGQRAPGTPVAGH